MGAKGNATNFTGRNRRFTFLTARKIKNSAGN